LRDLSAISIWRMPVGLSRRPPQALTNSAAVDVDPEWSSNGRIVFRSNRSGFNELWIAGVDGSRSWQATRFRGPFVGDPPWSPDGPGHRVHVATITNDAEANGWVNPPYRKGWNP
jgi:Tol biopolymer transport system component